MSPYTLRPFTDPERHEAISSMLARRSTNRAEIRAALLTGLGLGGIHRVLELGCGFGFLSEAVAARVAPAACYLGVDACAANGAPFLRRVAATGRRPSFLHMRLGAALPWPDRSFELVLCSWSLYFFPEIIAEISRVLAPGGLLLAITHDERAFTGLLEAGGLGDQGREAEALLRRFSARNGADLLAPSFGRVERVDYPNRLRFGPEHEDDLLAYLAFKLPVLLSEPPPGPDLPPAVAASARATLCAHGEVWVEKDDACFRCWEPR
ncbi:MAG: class I SAM-dependent methyltransferase [Pseudomonadota bacterium]